jgi:hypothetical protein
MYPEYEDGFILVEGEDLPQNVLAVFIGFAGTSPDHGFVKWVKVLPTGKVPEQKLYYTRWNTCRFVLIPTVKDLRRKIQSLTIEI